MIPSGPLAMPGQRIGLLGGSFDPPHEGHVHISRWALRAAGLDRVWWLVSPGNPLKADGPADIDRRMSAARALIRHPRIHVTDLERHLGSPYTVDTLAFLAARHPGVRFVWVMGADNMADFHRWRDWDCILGTYPVLVLARPGQQIAAGLSKAAQRFAHLRVAPSAAAELGRGGRPGWALLTGPMSEVSSTAIRRSGAWG